MGGSNFMNCYSPVTFHLGGDFGNEIGTSHFSPSIVLPLVLGDFPLLHSPDDFINLSLFQGIFAIGSLSRLLNFFKGLSSPGKTGTKSRIGDIREEVARIL
jgi:hypothetical protein